MNVDAETLGQLRGIARRLQSANDDGGTSMAEVVQLARDVQMSAGITVDFEAVPELGQPLLVVRVTSSSRTIEGLTPREQEVAQLIADGLTNKEIAARLHITLGTVKHYVHRILDKTGLQGRVAIATSLRGR